MIAERVLTILFCFSFIGQGIAELSFNRDIRPILSDKCFSCHGPDSANRKGNLRLDVREDALKEIKGRTPIVPGHPEKSEVMLRIEHEDEDEKMPPLKSHLSLRAEEVDRLRQWIREGAKYQKHWAFITPKKTSVPTVTKNSWPNNSIDNFILKELERKKIKPSPTASWPILMRRLSLDLTGLPLEASLQKKYENASERYEELVDELLSSPAYGEHMAFSWMEIARYADTHGYQKDNIRTMWPWRDWVVKAYNENLPFDEFTIQQLAGDLLPNATIDQKLASGFLRNHRINAEFGIIDEEYLTDYVFDRVENVGTAWMGLTLTCARCHDHKYDAISQKDYYKLFAFFNRIPEKGRDGVGPAPEPAIELTRPRIQKQLIILNQNITDDQRSLKEKLSNQKGWLKKKQKFIKSELERHQIWQWLEPSETVSKGGSSFKQLSDGSQLVSGANPLNDVYTLSYPVSLSSIKTLRLEALKDDSMTNALLSRSFDGQFLMTEVKVKVHSENKAEKPLLLKSAKINIAGEQESLNALIDKDLLTGWTSAIKQEEKSIAIVFELDKELHIKTGDNLVIEMHFTARKEQMMMGRFRWSVSTGEPNINADAISDKIANSILDKKDLISTSLKEQWLEYVVTKHPTLAKEKTKLEIMKTQSLNLLNESKVKVMVMKDTKMTGQANVLERGEYTRPLRKVKAGTLSALPNAKTGEHLSRLDLAKWLVAPENPLTARVAVNRLWQQFFGRGLVSTPEDFGSQGAWPSHPELLDWLALKWQDMGWDRKALIKLMLMSKTYQQSSKITMEHQKKDPSNQWLARASRYRLHASVIRDQALQVSGLLDKNSGGPPVRPYQPKGLWQAVAGINSNTAKYRADSWEKTRRRSLYTFWKRAVPPPGLNLLDAASREVCVVKKSLTNTPLQALAVMNDPLYHKAAIALAESQSWNNPELAIQNLNKKIVGRNLDKQEQQILLDTFEKFVELYKANPKALQGMTASEASLTVEQAAGIMLAHTLLNCDETLTRE